MPLLPLCIWSGRRVSNSRPQPWQGCALPTELLPRGYCFAVLLCGTALLLLYLLLVKACICIRAVQQRKRLYMLLRVFALQTEIWSGRRVSNSRPQPWQGCALPTELLPRGYCFAVLLCGTALLLLYLLLVKACICIRAVQQRKRLYMLLRVFALQTEIWSGRRVSNSRPQPWQGCALPTELLPHWFRKLPRTAFLIHSDQLGYRSEGAQSSTIF